LTRNQTINGFAKHLIGTNHIKSSMMAMMFLVIVQGVEIYFFKKALADGYNEPYK